MENIFSTVEEAVEEIRAGRMLIVTDNEDRENEGDFIMAAELVTPEDVNFVTRYGRGLLCQAITPQRARKLDLPLMVSRNTSMHETAFTISVDLRDGATTGISAFDRAACCRALVDPKTTPDCLRKPGHIFPLIARQGGVLERDGHTEAAADLARLAGLAPSGILCEILDEDGTMARVPRLAEIARQHNLKMLTIESLIRWRKENIARLAEARLPTRFGNFTLMAYENPANEAMPHLALVSEKPFSKENALVRVHSECFTGDLLASLRCDCGGQLHEAMRQIDREGGVLLYLRQEGRGIGLTEKIRAYALQDAGRDTVEANLALGFAPDERVYDAAAAILRNLGVRGLRLLTNNPAKADALKAAGFDVRASLPLEIEPLNENRRYMAVKKAKMGHNLTLI